MLEECSEDKLDEREAYWVDFYDSYYNGYNRTKNGLPYGEKQSNLLGLEDDNYYKDKNKDFLIEFPILFSLVNKKISGKSGNVRTLLLWYIIQDFNNIKLYNNDMIQKDCNMIWNRISEARIALQKLGFITHYKNDKTVINYYKIFEDS